MRLQMTMKRPVFFPELDPQAIPSCIRAASVREALQAYCEAVLDVNEPCMEASESAGEIVAELQGLRSEINVRKCGPDRYSLAKGNLMLTLCGHEETGEVLLDFSNGQAGIDMADFGPRDSACFIKDVFDSFSKVVAAINHRDNYIYS